MAAVEPNKGSKGGSVVLESGEKLSYDALVLAQGSNWEGPLAYPDDPEQVKEHLSFWRSQFTDATHVVLAGGGAVGIELAGEIKDVWPVCCPTSLVRDLTDGGFFSLRKSLLSKGPKSY